MDRTTIHPNRGSLLAARELAELLAPTWGDSLAQLRASGVPLNAVGQGSAAFMHNLPAPGDYAMDAALFNRETERSDVPQEVKSLSVGGSPIDVRVQNVGLITGVRLEVTGSLTVAGAGTCNSLHGWPWNLVKRFTLSANGQTGIIGCEGIDLRARRQRIYRNPREHVSNVQGNQGVDSTTLDPSPALIPNGTYTFRLVYDVPIVHDAATLTGALLAQTDQNYLSWRIQPAAASELFNLAGGSTAVVNGATVKVTNTFYDIPFVDVQGGRKVVIPDLRWLHGYTSIDQPFSNQGDVRVPLVRNAGQLIALHAYIENGPNATIDPALLTELRWEYGGNRRPRVFNPPTMLLEENGRNYNGLLKPSIFCLDFEVDNPMRDVVYPKGVTELAIVPVIPTSITVNASARVHVTEETLYAGR